MQLSPPMQGDKMKLTILERITLLQILPKEGDFITLKVLRDLGSVLGFSEEDHKKYKIVQNGDRVTWDNGKEEKDGSELEIGEKATEIIKEALLNMDKEKKLQANHMSVYEKFIQDK